MNDQKLENLLNLALDATDAEREKSLNMNFGYDRQSRIWELIVRYHGDLSGFGERTKEIILLSGGYAIIMAEESEIDWISSQPEIEYIEKPKRLFFSAAQGRSASCINPLQTGAFDLRGQGVLVAVIDSGVDYFHPDFRNEDGTTRIVSLWDQTIQRQRSKRNDMTETDTTEEEKNIFEEKPEAVGEIKEGTGEEIRGVEYTKEQIDEALAAGSREAGYRIVPSRDLSGHGTEVLGIAAGNGQASGGQYRGVASKSDILVVKIGTAGSDFAGTVELMLALDYVIRKAMELGKPVAINLSFGNVYGSHVPYTRGILGLNRSKKQSGSLTTIQ